MTGKYQISPEVAVPSPFFLVLGVDILNYEN